MMTTTPSRSKETEDRRMAGGRMLQRDVTPAEVARRLGVTRQAVSAWWRQLNEAKGDLAGLRAKARHPRCRLGGVQRKALTQILLAGARRSGFESEWWTIETIILVISREFGISYSRTGCTKLIGRLGLSPPLSLRRSRSAAPTGREPPTR